MGMAGRRTALQERQNCPGQRRAMNCDRSARALDLGTDRDPYQEVRCVMLRNGHTDHLYIFIDEQYN